MERLARFLLERSLPRGVAGESTRLDLEAELAERRSGRPGRGHGLWYLWEALKLWGHFAGLRAGRAPLPGGGAAQGPGLPPSHLGGAGAGSVAQDLRFAVRTLRRRPGFAALAVVTMGLGIGSATAMFSVVDGVLLRSVPFPEPDALVDVWLTSEGARGAPGLVGRTWDRLPLSLAEYRAWRQENTTFAAMAVHNAVETTLTGVGSAERISMGLGSASLLEVMGVRPALGRWFLPEEEGTNAAAGDAARVAVLSYECWRDRMGSDALVLGKAVTLDGEDHTVVGVLPAGFRLRHLGMHWLGEDGRGAREVWVPIGSPGLGNGNNLEALARLAPGVPPEAAREEARRILLADRGGRGEVRIVPRTEDETQGLSSPLWLLLGATGLLLLIGCANVATLSLGEMHARHPEMATRTALGAGKARLVRQLLTESLLLGLAGSAVGALLAVVGTRALVAMAPALPRVEAVEVNLRVLLFAGGAGTLAGMLFGTLPAFLAAGRSAAAMGSTTRTATRRSWEWERWLVPTEIALTMVLLVSGGLLARSLQRLLEVDPGFDAHGLATVSAYFPGDGYATPSDAVAALGEVLARVEALPGVSAASAITRLPFPGLTNTTTVTLPPAGGEEPTRFGAQQLYVMPGYHQVMGIPLVAGRFLDPGDDGSAPRGMLVTENIARRHWPGRSAVGAGVTHIGDVTIVGVVGDEKRSSLIVAPDPAFYMSLLQRPAREVSLVARTGGDAAALAGEMRDLVRAFDAGIPVRQVTTLPHLIQASAAQERYRALLLSLFALLATLLAAVGVFGTTARAVAQRSKEMGVRMSLGAGEDRLVGSVVARGLGAGLAGTAAGLLLAAGAGPLLAGFLFGVEPFDASTYGAAALLLLLVTGTACWLPARRIARLDPATVLRGD